LVELLVVIAILGILISLVTAGAQAARRRAAMAKAKSTIAALETAIAMYQGDMGAYPPSGNASLVEALEQDPDDIDWQGPYMEFKQDELERYKSCDFAISLGDRWRFRVAVFFQRYNLFKIPDDHRVPSFLEVFFCP